MKFLRIIPFLAIFVLASFTCFEILTSDYVFTTKHISAIILILINGIIYFVRYKPAVLLTGVLLFLATFNIINVFTSVSLDAFGFMIGNSTIAIPPFQGWVLLIFVLYLFINVRYLIDWKN